ncbi:SPOR domain-containing protein [Myroides sp. 1354]|uniref:SPOR domain-containing protein n=1 Tax=unclassified Myroides TaxID=2642485 RepID=UPI002575CB88|nr:MULTISPECIES: SPOR domain-containing protein [unclassified Myroides]MDM1044264.1 SPOR domain-containing protein [Myroides sp. R163-1]MDM1055200.1 SPOR domain-containing protein [Myroides sp. 1354]MDM1068497.1 SPOR domain-containing protein [Myroides sp. 1372]
MRILRIFPVLFCLFFIHLTSYAQERNNAIQEPLAVKKLVEAKRNTTTSGLNTDKYNIQVFYGKNNEAKAALARVKRLYPDLEATLVYSNPSYKVLAGNFKTRLEAERYLQTLKKDFDNSLLLRPGK